MRNYVICVYFGDTSEYVQWETPINGQTTKLIENALWFLSKKNAKKFLSDVVSFGESKGWQVSYQIEKI
jgi:hypothetical protein